jgi:hypothetical protein
MELKTPIRQHLHLQALARLNAEVRQELLTSLRKNRLMRRVFPS